MNREFDAVHVELVASRVRGGLSVGSVVPRVAGMLIPVLTSPLGGSDG